LRDIKLLFSQEFPCKSAGDVPYKMITSNWIFSCKTTRISIHGVINVFF